VTCRVNYSALGVFISKPVFLAQFSTEMQGVPKSYPLSELLLNLIKKLSSGAIFRQS